MAALIDFRDVSKTFNTGSSTVKALESITLQIDDGDIFAIIGGSGAGKSTLIRLINALESVTSGNILIEGTDITALKEKDIRQIRSRMGMIFQQFNLMRSRTVYGNVAFPLKVGKWPKDKQKERVAELLTFVGLADKAWSYPDQLSGGQKQRVGLARALATNPSILLADESTSALDPETTEDVLKLLQRVNTELGVTIVVITHEMDVVRAIANRVAVLDRGRLIEVGSVYDVFSAPKADTTRKFVDAALQDRPEADDAVRLRQQYDGRLVSVQLGNHDKLGTILADSIRTSDVHFEIVFGGITALDGGSFGNITLALTGSTEAVDRLIAALAAVTEVEEIA
jgi:D-methionine transport system ATP-binding protein